MAVYSSIPHQLWARWRRIVSFTFQPFSVGEDTEEHSGPQTRPESCAEVISFSPDGSRRPKVTVPLLTELFTLGGFKAWEVNSEFKYAGKRKKQSLKKIKFGVMTTEVAGLFLFVILTSVLHLSYGTAPWTRWYFGHVAWPFPFSLRVTQLLRKRA